ncbi:hypothetical protein AKO63_1459 [Escherichia coli]|nr:hypothetical protein AKO63_1459 [Escherichia coli]
MKEARAGVYCEGPGHHVDGRDHGFTVPWGNVNDEAGNLTIDNAL